MYNKIIKKKTTTSQHAHKKNTFPTRFEIDKQQGHKSNHFYLISEGNAIGYP